MGFSDKYRVDYIGKEILHISKGIVDNPEFREVIEIGGSKEIVAKADVMIEDAVADFLKKIPVNLDGEEKRRRVLCENPLGLIAFDPVDGTNNFVNGSFFYCSIATIFDSPEPKTLGEAVWAGIYDHVSSKRGYFDNGNVYFVNDKGNIPQKPESPRIKSISDLTKDNFLNLSLDFGPREIPEDTKPYDDILAKSWRKNVSCAGYHLMEVASGGSDAYICPVQKPEELVAGIPMIEASGGAVLTFDGKRAGDLPYDFDKRYSIVAARTPQLARELVGMIKSSP
ncbi:hypothetical protein HOE04_02790 [archaeon]|nr:hypothetical protein [archaeon]